MRILNGIYRAVCLGTDTDTGVVRCQVPQIFSQETVTCLDRLGGLPIEGTVGWVSFEAGYPDHPVWMSGGSGGAGDGADEVWVGPNDPGGSIELWYDTDAISFSGGGGSGSDSNRVVPVIIFNGESNSGGYAQNEQATPTELAPRPAVQIFDNTGMASFQDLDIGTNNLVGHAGLTANATHGWELGLANSVEAGQWWNNTVYLIKTGQGGSRIAQWNEGGSYWTTFLDRTRAGLSILRSAGLIPVIYVWYSLGINDAIDGINEAVWKANVEEFFIRLRQELGFVPIVYSHAMASSVGANFNDSIDAMAAADNMIQVVEATGTTTRDANHWDYTGMKVMSGRMGVVTRNFGQGDAYNIRRVDLLATGGKVIAPPVILPALIISPTVISFYEGTAGATFTVRLNRVPTANVVVSVSAVGGGAVPSPASLTFTTTNWGTNQTVTVTSPNDGTASGNRSSTVTLASAGVSVSATVAVTILDSAPSIPINLSAPVASGTATVDSTLTCTTGSWSGMPLPTLTYQWKRDGTNISGETASTHIVVTADLSHALTCVVTATNTQGVTSATSNGITIEVPIPPVVWGNFVNTDSPSAGTVRVLTNGGTTGAMVATAIDLTQPFDIEIEYASSSATTACVVFVDSDSNPAFQWGGSQIFLFGTYHSSSSQAMTSNGGSYTYTGISLSFPCRVKMSKFGNDVVFRNAPSGGTYGPVIGTMSGVLAGQTTGYLKCLYAVAAASQSIKVNKL